jgi:hypothetical protein
MTMLLAEIRGKQESGIRDSEDYLTSTVFGHLRYVTPGPFWQSLLSRARTLAIDGIERSLTEIVGTAHQVPRYTKINISFWPKCPGLGEPELALCLTGGVQQPLVILIEVKLWSPKSGEGEHDQLKRYLQIADEVNRLTPAVPSDALVLVVYLTPRDASREIQESLQEYGDTPESRRRLFRLQWQDMIDAIGDALELESEHSRLILSDVRDFLRAQGLEYFHGFRKSVGIESLKKHGGSFYGETMRFRGFRSVSSVLQVIRGAWTCPRY